jgi:addiction module HigA family antidote
MSRNRLAHAIGVPGNRTHAIVNGSRDITADTDLRLCKFFGLSEGYFLRLQNAYDMFEAKRRIAGEVAKIKRYKTGRAA